MRLSRLTQPGWAIVFAAATLFVIGLLSIYATETDSSDWPRNTIKQLATLLLGIGISMAILRLQYDWFMRHAGLIVALAVAALVPLVLARYISFGNLIPHRRGSYRWIQLPAFQLQPSEFMKVAYIIGLAAYLRFRQNYRTFKGLLIPVLGSAIPMFLILLEPDLGTVLLMIPVLFVMLYVAGAKIKHLAALAGIGLMAAPLAWVGMQPYQKSRFLGVLFQSDALRERIIQQPDKFDFLATPRQALQWEVDSGMQLLRSKAALGSGAMTGQGWRQGTFVEYNFLPDRHNDFVFAIVGHQWGFMGCLLVLLCYGVIVLAGVEITASNDEPFARLLAVGVIALMTSQAMINIGMTLGLMPITGMTLPFVSYGGSSLLTNMIAISLLLSVGRRRPFLLANRPFEFGRSQSSASELRPMPTYRSRNFNT